VPDDRQDLVDLIYRCPRDIAVGIGYDKLTDLHNKWIRDMVFGEGDHTLQAHRGSFKTTCLGIAFAFIIVLFPGDRTIFMRKTDADVAEVLAATASVLRTGHFRAIVRSLYGIDLVLTKETQSEVSTNLRQGVSGASQLVGLGCGGSITGKHADRVFTDDIVNVKDRVSAAERERIKLIYQELQNIKNRGGRIYNTGTPWHKDDAFTLMPDIERWDCYSTGLISREELASIEASMSVSLFAANYKLKHIADEEAMFSEPSYFSDPSELADGIAHLDAAYGGADGTALTLLNASEDGWRAHIRLWPGRHVDDCLPEVIRLCRELRVGSIHLERNADKGYLRKKVIRMGHPCIAYTESTNKFIKISTYLKTEWPRIRLLDCDAYPLDAGAVNEVLDYSENAAHDDMPDSMASALRAYSRRPKIKRFKEGV
jgi:hypothetical protein